MRIGFLPALEVRFLDALRALLLLDRLLPGLVGLLHGSPIVALARIVGRLFTAHAGPPRFTLSRERRLSPLVPVRPGRPGRLPPAPAAAMNLLPASLVIVAPRNGPRRKQATDGGQADRSEEHTSEL